jgi:hypothetical protein
MYAPQHMAAPDKPVYLWCCSQGAWIEFHVNPIHELWKGRTAYELSTYTTPLLLSTVSDLSRVLLLREASVASAPACLWSVGMLADRKMGLIAAYSMDALCQSG